MSAVGRWPHQQPLPRTRDPLAIAMTSSKMVTPNPQPSKEMRSDDVTYPWTAGEGLEPNPPP